MHTRCPPRVLVSAFLTMGACALLCTEARAQPSEDEIVQRARTFFQEGLDFADHGDWERAVHRFRRALELRESDPIRFNLARSLSEMGRSVEALGELERLLDEERVSPEVRDAAARLQARIRRRLGRLVVQVEGQAEGAHVTVDGLPLPPERLGAPILIDPGVRVARLLRGTEQLDVEEVEVPRGGHARVVLAVPALALDAGPSPANGDGEVWAWVLGTAGVLVAIGVGTAIGVAVTGGAAPMGDFSPPVLEID